MGLPELTPHRRVPRDPEPIEDSTRERAQVLASITMERVFVNGAVLSAQGIVSYPFPMPATQTDLLSTGNRILFEEGRIIHVRPEEVGARAKDPSHPPALTIIPPHSHERLAFVRHIKTVRKPREIAPSIHLLHGMDKNGAPLSDMISYSDLYALKAVIERELEAKGIDPKNNLPPLLSITRRALVEVASMIGLGELKTAIEKLRAETASGK